MTIDIAYRLVELRRKNGYSQEELAEKLGLSRQAVSKWERAEASPDTDNLIALARLYGISLDELVGNTAAPAEGAAARDAGAQGTKIDREGVHIESTAGNAHIGRGYIHAERQGRIAHVDKDGVYVDGAVRTRVLEPLSGIIALLAVTVYLLLGVVWDLWHPTWLLLLAVPVFISAVEAFRKKDPSRFAFPVLVAFVYCVLGVTRGLWHPMWVLFLFIPVYYAFFPGKRDDPDTPDNA